MLKIFIFLPLILIFLFPVLIALFGAVGFAAWKALTFESRFRKYFVKYKNNDELARMIAARKIWTGQSAEELRDARGAPLQIETTADGEIWTYQANPLTRRPLQIILRDGRIAEWIG